ncbi:sporulation inhibitor of replication protein SirA [Mesobacillus harenae]|uniref:sporulation inhibitor of replication protein SirA n=1 Tax=Mesobacillus harenae TaxID=2213203 RepID=UPI001580DE25|nr:sporulation inhibitor of replication protein SirA [Mesobacillus harenae]
MRSYQLYLIEEEIAAHYFGRERMFIQLFQDYAQARGSLKKIISRQINYITRQIPVLRLHQLLHHQLSLSKDLHAEQGVYYIRKNRGKSVASLKTFDRYILVESDGNVDAETAFFEVLRKCESSFLAIDIDSSRCGWLKPIKERKYV